MIHRAVRWLMPIVLALVCCGAALAQAGKDAGGEEQPTRTSVIVSFALAFAFTLGVLVILCMPSRKS